MLFRSEGEEYEDCMKEAENLYLENKTKFDESPLSEVIYLHSHARFISKKRIPGKPKEVYERALKICEQKLSNHPERAATFLFAGRNSKRRNEYERAGEQLQQALDLFKKCLGEHIMTASALKISPTSCSLPRESYQKVNEVLMLFFHITKSLWKC